MEGTGGGMDAMEGTGGMERIEGMGRREGMEGKGGEYRGRG